MGSPSILCSNSGLHPPYMVHSVRAPESPACTHCGKLRTHHTDEPSLPVLPQTRSATGLLHLHCCTALASTQLKAHIPSLVPQEIFDSAPLESQGALFSGFLSVPPQGDHVCWVSDHDKHRTSVAHWAPFTTNTLVRSPGLTLADLITLLCYTLACTQAMLLFHSIPFVSDCHLIFIR